MLDRNTFDVVEYDPGFQLTPHNWPGFVKGNTIRRLSGFEHGLTQLVEPAGVGSPHKLRLVRVCAALSSVHQELGSLVYITAHYDDVKSPVKDIHYDNDDMMEEFAHYFESIDYFVRPMIRDQKSGILSPTLQPARMLVLPKAILPLPVTGEPVTPHIRFVTGEHPQIGEEIYTNTLVTEVAAEYERVRQ